MAEYCLDCLNKMNQTNEKKHQYIMSKHLELCEGCGKLKPVVIAKRGNVLMQILCTVMFPLRVLRYGICFLSGLLICNRKNSNHKSP